jgi:hypothetical protein
MIIHTYPLCLVGTETSNDSRTERLQLIFGDCARVLGFNEEDECGACYCQPFIDGDKFIFQIPLESYDVVKSVDLYTLDEVFIANVELFDATSLLTEFGAFTNLEFDMSTYSTLAGVDCFKVLVSYTDIRYMSGGFCKVQCNEPTLLFCSDYTKKDCNGTIYNFSVIHNASTLPAVVYSNCMRLKAVIERKGVAEENTYDEVNTSLSTRIVHTKSKTIDQYELRIWGIPEWQVDRIKAVLAGKNLTITAPNGRIYTLQVKSGFEKGNEKGSLWFPIIKLEKSCEIINKNC